MDQKIQKQLEELQKAIAKISANMLTKNDAKNFVTKNDVKNFATKDDLRSELAKHATKDDLVTLKNALTEEIKESEGFIVASADKNKADKKDVEISKREF